MTVRHAKGCPSEPGAVSAAVERLAAKTLRRTNDEGEREPLLRSTPAVMSQLMALVIFHGVAHRKDPPRAVVKVVG
jgi:hypothetical protein